MGRIILVLSFASRLTAHPPAAKWPPLIQPGRVGATSAADQRPKDATSAKRRNSRSRIKATRPDKPPLPKPSADRNIKPVGSAMKSPKGRSPGQRLGLRFPHVNLAASVPRFSITNLAI